jgi:UDPglucose 6-dehydrogenase
MGADKRIGTSFLFPGVGYGGSCFPKDVKAMIHFASQKDYEFRILKAVEEVNSTQKTRLVKRMTAHFGGAEREDDRGMGPRLQAAHRRHA